ncbi:MAG: AAA family ATPase [Peptostreptococcaceae bacterium]|nr:AAA family ATPase [Peptostreptococcaceae bacterium]
MEKVITYFGTDSGVGTTMIAQSVSENLTKEGKKVLLMLCSGNYGNDYIITDEEASLDDIKANLISGYLGKEDIEGILIKINGLDIMPGIRDITRIKYYLEDDLDKIISVVRDDYDYIVIDGGCNINYGITVSSLLVADKIYFIITQQEKSIRRFINEYYSVLYPMKIEGRLISNKYVTDYGNHGISEIESFIGKEPAINVEYAKEGWIAEIRKTTLLSDAKFKAGIENIVSDITGIETKKSKFSFLSR